MAISIQHNIGMLNANRQLNINTSKKAKSAEKLSSGYRINRAADDAAGLSISEKMRWMIRGLNQGTENAQDGVSWVQIGDGSLEEAHAILHRMTELAIKASNETSSDGDRALMQVEFDQLQKELDRLTDSTYFNEQHIFQDHEIPYYQIEGSTQWPQAMSHNVRAGENDLMITYRQKESEQPKTASITVPPGNYTTRELMDEIDSAFRDAGISKDGIVFEYTQLGYCNLNLEGGEKIDEVSGGLSYLLFENYGGGDLGALIGTTVFKNDDQATILVQNNTNDYLTFKVISADDSEPPKDIVVDLDEGRYTKNMLIDILNEKLKEAGTNVVAEKYGTGIKLSSPDYIISEFKGNMFEIDGALFTSIFYDNIQHADITYTNAEFKGGYVLLDPDYLYNNRGYDPENAVFHFTKGVNDLLVLQPNEGEEITIDLSSMDGHTMVETCEYLQSMFDQNGVKLKVEAASSPSTTGVTDINGKQGNVRYMRIEITSGEEGMGSKVGINKTKSTAYATLFTAQNTTPYKNDAEFGGNDTVNDGNAYLEGRRSLNSGLNIKKDVNDSFIIQVSSDKAVAITLEAKKYANAEELAAEIQTKLKDAGYGEDVISVTVSPSGAIRLRGEDTKVTGIRVSGVPGNEGYRDIFQGDKILPKSVSQSGAAASIILPEKAVVHADGSVYVDPAYGNLMVRMDGQDWRQVNVGGNWNSLKDLENHITEAMKPTEANNQFTRLSTRGSSKTTSVSVTSSSSGSTLTSARAADYDKSGKTITTGSGEGATGDLKENSGATVTFQKPLPDKIEITAQNKDFTFRVNGGQKQTIDLSKELGKTTFNSPAEFQTALQAAINQKLGKQPEELGGVKVSLDSSGKTLVLTAGLKKAGGGEGLGMNTQITLDVGTKGGFIYNLHDASKPASMTLGGRESGYTKAANNSFTTKGDTTLKLTLTRPKEGGGTVSENINLTLNGTYTRDSLINELNTKLDGKAKVSFDTSGRMVFTTVDKGDGCAISVDQSSPAISYFFGYPQDDGSYNLTDGHAAEATINQTVQSNIKIEAGTEQNFTIKVDGVDYTAKLGAKSYDTPQQIADEIKKQVNAAAHAKNNNNVDVLSEVSIKNGKLYFKTASKGTNSALVLSYDANSSMKKIYGTRPVAGVKASFRPDGQLTLTRIGEPQTGGSIYVTSDLVDSDGNSISYRGGSFIFPNKEPVDPEPYDGYHSVMHSYMDGVALAFNKDGKVDINQWNNYLSFYYTEHYDEPSNNPQRIQVTLLEKDGGYTMEELKDALQESIDRQTAYQRRLEVTVDKNGVRIEAVNAGKRYRIYTNADYKDTNTASPFDWRPSGNFYEKVICSAKSTKKPVPIASDKDGKQLGDEVFAVGRQDVKNNTVRIQKDGNDSLSLEFTIPGNADPIKLEMMLDPGYYKGDTLVKQIQTKLDEALEKAGLPKGLIEAGIGIVNTKIQGSLDDRALAFKLSDKVAAPVKGSYGIEAIGGTAAFSVFYQTEGDIARAYIKSSKDITKGVEIKEGATDFSVDVDGVTYKIDLTPGSYTATELVAHIDDLLKAQNSPLRAVEDGGALKLMHTKYGKHKITNLTGAVKNQLFFVEKGEKRGSGPINLRLSSVSGDHIGIDRPWMNTVSLGVNTVLISKTKYAQKAIGRLKEAVTKVSEVRSYFGTTQNRLESTIRNNENKAENTTAAESRIRDADFSKEMMENTIYNMLEQAGTSVMTQTKLNSQLVLQLLS